MKKITRSLVFIAAIAALAVSGTMALFHDDEISKGNTFTAGTIDIAVNGNNPWESSKPYVLEDMKPSYTDYIEFEINNVGDNPANVWKKLANIVTEDNTQSEPECEDAKGQWNDKQKTCDYGNGSSKNDIDTVINYDLKVEVFDKGGNSIWNQIIYTDSDNKSIKDVYGNLAPQDHGVLLGMIPAGGKMKVSQSYHMRADTGNWAQGDKMTFDINLYAEQLTNTVKMVHKDGAQTNDIVQPDAATKYATVEYKVKDKAFTYKIDVVGGPVPDGQYTLISYLDPWPGAGSTALANVTVSGGTAQVEGSIDLGKSLKNAKTWLIPGTYTPGNLTGNLSWNPTNTLFETALMDYYDSDIE